MSSHRVIVDPNGRQFSAESMDRFGDDMCQFILSYLELYDKLRMECVSQQWKRLIFTNVFSIKQCDYFIVRRMLMTKESQLFDKCPNLTNIDLPILDINLELLPMIVNCGPRLESKSFHLNLKLNRSISLIAILELGKLLGNNIKAIHFCKTNDYIVGQQLLMQYCPNLKYLVCHNFLQYDISDKGFVPNLERISRIDLMSVTYNGGHIENFKFGAFVNKYEHKIKDLDIIIGWYSPRLFVPINGTEMVINLEQISRFSNLEKLKMRLDKELFIQTKARKEKIKRKMVIALNGIGAKCHKSKRISLEILFGLQFDFWETFDRLNNLIELRVSILKSDLRDFNEEMKPLMKLKKLIINCRSITNNFSANLIKLAPNLEIFKLYSEERLPCDSLLCLSQFKRLTELALRCYAISTTYPSVVYIIKECQKPNKIIVELRSSPTQRGLEMLREIASNRPNQTITFLCYPSNPTLNSFIIKFRIYNLKVNTYLLSQSSRIF